MADRGIHTAAAGASKRPGGSSAAAVVDPLADFVIVAEFSEKEGPVARCALGPQRERFPLDAFVLRIMSVELSVEGHEKWSVWLDWAAQGVEALVVHFQLADLNARGYVRPLAIAYISSYPLKLIKYRSFVLRMLYAAADSMLKPNRALFRRDVHQRLLDLRCMLELHDQEQTLSLDVSLAALPTTLPPKDQLQDSFDELTLLLNALPMESETVLQDSSAQSADAAALNSAVLLTDRIARFESLQKKHSLYDKQLRDLDELTEGAFSSLAKPFLLQGLQTLQHQPQILLHDSFVETAGVITPRMPRILSVVPAASPVTLLSLGMTPLLNLHLDTETHFIDASALPMNTVLPSPDEGETLHTIASQLWPSSAIGASSQFVSHLSPYFAIAHKSCTESAIMSSAKPFTLLELLRGRLSWMKHCLFSLLKGRPVIILAEPQHALLVSHAVDMLQVFVPGGATHTSPSRIIPWWPHQISTVHTEPPSQIGGDIRLPHLHWLKLAGVDRRCSIARAVDRYVTVWDWETETLRAPPYNLDENDLQSSSTSALPGTSRPSVPQGAQSDASFFNTPYLSPQPGGRILETILQPKKSWPSNSTFRAHVHAILFNELALKASIYYHVCCLAVQPTVTEAVSSSTGARVPTLLKSRSMTDLAQQIPADQGAIQRAGVSIQEVPIAAASSFALRERARAAFFLRMNVLEQDAEIIDYLAEVVKFQQQQQHIKSGMSSEPAQADLPGLPIQLDYSPCRLFRNTTPSVTATGSGSGAAHASSSNSASAIASMMI